MTEEGFTIDGELQPEPNPQKETLPYTEGIDFPVKLQKDEIFLLGDDRENSADSRVYGAIQQKDTLGKVLNIIRRRNF
jgi:signal peptidase I